nr:uncharacterized protein LOC117281217 [Nicotiana tomentosiformis]
MKERQQSKGYSYNLYGFPWAFMAWEFESIPQLRPKDSPKERTLPRMKRWLFEKVEKDRPDPFQIKDRPECAKFLMCGADFGSLYPEFYKESVNYQNIKVE